MKILLVGGPCDGASLTIADGTESLVGDFYEARTPWIRGDDFAYRRTADFRVGGAAVFVYVGPHDS